MYIYLWLLYKGTVLGLERFGEVVVAGQKHLYKKLLSEIVREKMQQELKDENNHAASGSLIALTSRCLQA